MSILKNFVNPWESGGVLDNGVTSAEVLEDNILGNNYDTSSNLIKTKEYAIASFLPLAVNNRYFNVKTLGATIGKWHNEYMSNKVYKGAFQELKGSQLKYRPEVHFHKIRHGGAFYDERVKRTGSLANPYAIVFYTNTFSGITSGSDALFEEVMHAILHRHYKIIKPRKVNYLYEELAVRVAQAYAGIVHPQEYRDDYMKGFMENQAVKDYFVKLEEKKGLNNLVSQTKLVYLNAFENLKKMVYRQYIGKHASKNDNKLSSVSAIAIEPFMKFIIQLAND